METTVHSDAYRDIDVSWETDERGFIAEDEEAICGLQGDQRWWAAHGLSFGVEGGNGALVSVGPVPGFNGICDYYWHGNGAYGGSASLGTWNRIIDGSGQGLDSDISEYDPHAPFGAAMAAPTATARPPQRQPSRSAPASRR